MANIRSHWAVRLGATVFLILGAVALRDLAAWARMEAPSLEYEGRAVLELRQPTVLYTAATHAGATDLDLAGDNLVMVDFLADEKVKVIDRTSGREVLSFGRDGEGPGEFRGAWSVDATDDGRFWVHDAGLSRLTYVDLDAVRAGGEAGDSILVLRAPSTVLDPVWLDGEMYSLGFFPSGRIGRIDRSGVYLGAMGPRPLADTDVPATVAQHAYQSRMQPHPDGDRFAVVTRHADRLEIYDREGRLLTEGERLFSFDPEFSVGVRDGRPQLQTEWSLRFGYIDVATTRDHIYALFSGRTRRGHEEGTANLGSFVHIFDWSGRLLDVLDLRQDAMAIAVAPEDRVLYAARHYPFPAILSYELP